MADKPIQPDQPYNNPFTPYFGKIPQYFAGRDEVFDEIITSLEGDVPTICALFVGPRGSGKTALMSALGNEAQRFGWVSIDVSALPDMLETIYHKTKAASAHLIDTKPQKKISSVGISGIGSVSWEREDTTATPWCIRMERLLDLLNAAGVGLMITIDEVKVSLPDMIELVTTYQHWIREDRRVSLLMAGLPYNVDALIKGESTSFLRRAERYDLKPLSDVDVKEAFKLTVEEGGRTIDRSSLEDAAKAIDGFPFMFQLLGYRAWRTAGSSPALTEEHIAMGADAARQRLKERVYDATYAELSEGDRAFLFAMLEDEDRTTRASLMERLGRPTGHISTYKRRLIQAGVIDETLGGDYRFSLPGFREYLTELKG